MHTIYVGLTILFYLNNFKTISTEYDNFNVKNVSETEEIIIKYANSVIHAHSDFESIFHFDTLNLHIIEELLENLNEQDTFKGVNLILYNQNVRYNKLFKRPTVRRILHVIALNEVEQFASFLNETANINEKDEALFIITNKRANYTFLTKDLNIKVFGKILVVHVDSNNVTINSICYFCGKKNQKLIQLPVYSNSFQFKRLFEQKDFSNLQKHVFHVGFRDYFPFVWCNRPTETAHGNVCTKPFTKGSEYELIKIMAQQLNFKFHLFRYTKYKDLFDDLSSKRIDFIIGGVTPTPQRMENASVTRPYTFEDFRFLYVLSKSLNEELKRVFDPFRGFLWLLVVSSILVTSGFLYALDRNQVKAISYLDSFWVCLYMAVEQSVNIKQGFKIRLTSSFLIMAWILVCFNVSTAYKSKLSAIVMNPPYKEPTNLRDLVRNGYSFIVSEDYHDVIYSVLLNNSDPIVQKAASLTVIKKNLCEMFVYVVEHRAAILDEFSSLQYDLRNSCKSEIEAKRSESGNKFGTHVRITQAPLRTVGHVWFLQERAVYRSAFDVMLEKIVEAGLLSLWTNQFPFKMRNGTFPESHNYITARFFVPISCKLLISLFFVYAIGNCSAIVAFLIELRFHNLCNKRQK